MTFLQTAASLRAVMGVQEDVPMPEAIRTMSVQMGLPVLDPNGAPITLPLQVAALKEAFVRRYTLDTRPWNPFHTDRYEITCNVELSAGGAESYSGGVLLGLYDGEVRRITREEGEATLHSSKLLHAVTKMTSGTRYSLILFFDRMRRTS